MTERTDSGNRRKPDERGRCGRRPRTSKELDPRAELGSASVPRCTRPDCSRPGTPGRRLCSSARSRTARRGPDWPAAAARTPNRSVTTANNRTRRATKGASNIAARLPLSASHQSHMVRALEIPQGDSLRSDYAEVYSKTYRKLVGDSRRPTGHWQCRPGSCIRKRVLRTRHHSPAPEFDALGAPAEQLATDFRDTLLLDVLGSARNNDGGPVGAQIEETAVAAGRSVLWWHCERFRTRRLVWRRVMAAGQNHCGR